MRIVLGPGGEGGGGWSPLATVLTIGFRLSLHFVSHSSGAEKSLLSHDFAVKMLLPEHDLKVYFLKQDLS